MIDKDKHHCENLRRDSMNRLLKIRKLYISARSYILPDKITITYKSASTLFSYVFVKKKINFRIVLSLTKKIAKTVQTYASHCFPL